MNRGVSIIICCYNSQERLPQTLSYLANQKVEKSLPWEIVVVDNASTDDTKLVAINEWNKHNLMTPLSVIDESIAGLSFARKKGISVSRYNVLIFCDDDNWLTENYVQDAFAFITGDPKIGAIGGQGVAVTQGELPVWFDKYKKFYACYPQAAETGELTGHLDFLYGAGLVIKREAYSQIYSSKMRLLVTDRVGEKLMSGGDNELCYLLKLAGYKIWYLDRLKFYHYMPRQRLTIGYLFMLINSIAYSSMSLIMYYYVISEKKVSHFTWISDVIYRLWHLVKSLIKSIFIREKFERSIEISVKWAAFCAVINQFGRYRKTYQSILDFKNKQIV